MKNFIYMALFLFVFFGCQGKSYSQLTSILEEGSKPVSLMGPLLVANEDYGVSAEVSWERFTRDLRYFKNLGVEAVTTDVWWGLTELVDDEFDFGYYRAIAGEVTRAGLKWIPILSFHQCGGNVGDECDVPIPSWLGAKYQREAEEQGMSVDDLLFYRSETGGLNREAISVWGSAFAEEEFRSFMFAFQEAFSDYANHIPEVNISLGPAGELRFPSYNAVDGWSYPERGFFQASSEIAIRNFRESMLDIYGNLDGIQKTWGYELDSMGQILPPSSDELGDLFIGGKSPDNRFLMDFLTWYQSSLLQHGSRLLDAATDVFHDVSSPFILAKIGAKIPGIHWRIGSVDASENIVMDGDRAAELTSGLISARSLARRDSSRGYREILALFKNADTASRTRGGAGIVLHFTALEMNNQHTVSEEKSLAKELVGWVAEEASRQSLEIKGENALSGNLFQLSAWENLEQNLQAYSYSGITLLRMIKIEGTALELFRAFMNQR